MENPYEKFPAEKFWKPAVADLDGKVRPTIAGSFRIEDDDKLATVGSCFAQNVGKHLRQTGFHDLYLGEKLREEDPIFSARYGNIYTARQLLELMREASSGRADSRTAIRRKDGRFVDVLRPYMESDGFDTPEAVLEARQVHVEAVRKMLSSTDVFIFTLGMTEAWPSGSTGRNLPICPGIYSDDDTDTYAFHNFTAEEVTEDMNSFLSELRAVNETVRVILTVSPVPLAATYTDEHVFVATMHSKAILRVAAGSLERAHENVSYFPSYEMIANPFIFECGYAENLRTVRKDAIEEIMAIFDEDYLGRRRMKGKSEASAEPVSQGPDDDVMCDDLQIERSVGF